MRHVEDNYSTRRRLLRSLGVVGVSLMAGYSGKTRPTGGNETADEVRAENEGNGTEYQDPEYPDRREINGISVYRRRYDLAELPIEEWPQYGEDRILPPYCEYPNAAVVDEEIPDLQTNTVTLFDVEDDEGHHPLRTARTMMRLVHCYREDDGPGHFWIEEYPTEPPNHVLNGFVVGLFGLYDYWLHVDREAGYDPLCAALTTVEDHIDDYREPGEISWYALSRGFRGNAHYHSTHINQFELLANLSGEERFAEAAETFRNDHPYEEYRPDRRDWA